MTTPPDLSSNIQGNATSPLSASADGVTATQQNPADVILADRYLAAKQATQGPPFGMLFAAVIAPGGQGNSRSGVIPSNGGFCC